MKQIKWTQENKLNLSSGCWFVPVTRQPKARGKRKRKGERKGERKRTCGGPQMNRETIQRMVDVLSISWSNVHYDVKTSLLFGKQRNALFTSVVHVQNIECWKCIAGKQAKRVQVEVGKRAKPSVIWKTKLRVADSLMLCKSSNHNDRMCCLSTFSASGWMTMRRAMDIPCDDHNRSRSHTKATMTEKGGE